MVKEAPMFGKQEIGDIERCLSNSYSQEVGSNHTQCNLIFGQEVITGCTKSIKHLQTETKVTKWQHHMEEKRHPVSIFSHQNI